MNLLWDTSGTLIIQVSVPHNIYSHTRNLHTHFYSHKHIVFWPPSQTSPCSQPPNVSLSISSVFLQVHRKTARSALTLALIWSGGIHHSHWIWNWACWVGKLQLQPPNLSFTIHSWAQGCTFCRGTDFELVRDHCYQETKALFPLLSNMEKT